MPRHNAVTGAAFVWEQERFDPVTRRIFCYISLRDPASRQVPTTEPSRCRGQMPKTRVLSQCRMSRPSSCMPAEASTCFMCLSV